MYRNVGHGQVSRWKWWLSICGWDKGARINYALETGRIFRKYKGRYFARHTNSLWNLFSQDVVMAYRIGLYVNLCWTVAYSLIKKVLLGSAILARPWHQCIISSADVGRQSTPLPWRYSNRTGAAHGIDCGREIVGSGRAEPGRTPDSSIRLNPRPIQEAAWPQRNKWKEVGVRIWLFSWKSVT